MSQGKVLQISKSVVLETDPGASTEKRKTPTWKLLLSILGFMNHKDEPQINGTAILFAILFGLAMIYIFLGGTVNFALMVDEKRADNMLDKTAARRAQDKFAREQEKRAELLEFNKKKGVYDETPEHLKVFEPGEVVSENK